MAPRRDILANGLIYALAAYGFWGLVPIYFKLVATVSPWEVVAHRVVWSVVFTAGLITWQRGWPQLTRDLRGRRVMTTLFFSSILVTSNWLIFIAAVGTGHVLECSLGYFINPLLNVLLGMVFLSERLNRAQTIAVVLAALGTLNLAVNLGQVPWIALSLAFTFSTYGLLRKRVKIGSLGGLFVETALMAPWAAAWLIWLLVEGQAAFGARGPAMDFTLLAAGVVTTLPLLWFATAARSMPYSTLGLCQYLAPTLQFSLAVFAYGEHFTLVHLVTFAFIWTGLAIFAADGLRKWRATHVH